MTIKRKEELFGDNGPNGTRSPIDTNPPPGMGAKNRAIKFGEMLTSYSVNRICYALELNDEDLEDRLHLFETGGLNALYRLGVQDIPGGGRVITIDGGAVEARSAHDTQLDHDSANACFRANLLNDTVEDGVGFDVVGSGSGAGAAGFGFLDRRNLSFATSKTTISSLQSGTLNVANADRDSLTVSAGAFFSASGQTELLAGIDLLEIISEQYSGVYLIKSVDSANKVTLAYLDGSEPSFVPNTAALLRLYRPIFTTAGGARTDRPTHGVRLVAPPAVSGMEPALTLVQPDGTGLLLRARTPTIDALTVAANGDTVVERDLQVKHDLNVLHQLAVRDDFIVDPTGNTTTKNTAHILGVLDVQGRFLVNLDGSVTAKRNVLLEQGFSVRDDFTVDTLGQVTVKQHLEIIGSLEVQNALRVLDDGNTVVLKDLGVSGKLEAVGDSRFTNKLTIGGEVYAEAKLTAGHVFNAVGAAHFFETVRMDLPLDVYAATNLHEQLTCDKVVLVKGAATFEQNVSVLETLQTKELVVTEGLTGRDGHFTEGLSVDGALALVGAAQLGGTLDVAGDTTVQKLTASEDVITDKVVRAKDVRATDFVYAPKFSRITMETVVRTVALVPRNGWYHSPDQFADLMLSWQLWAGNYTVDLTPYLIDCERIVKVEALVKPPPNAVNECALWLTQNYWDPVGNKYWGGFVGNGVASNLQNVTQLLKIEPGVPSTYDRQNLNGIGLHISGGLDDSTNVQPQGARIHAVRLTLQRQLL